MEQKKLTYLGPKYAIFTKWSHGFLNQKLNIGNMRVVHAAYVKRNWKYYDSLREKCPYSKFFWSVFSHIRTEYGPEKLQIRTLFTQWFTWFTQKPFCWLNFESSLVVGSTPVAVTYLCLLNITKEPGICIAMSAEIW